MDYRVLRDHMVDEQLIPRGIKDGRVLAAFRKVERHLFIPDKLRPAAYADGPLPVGEGQTISQPYMVALMTELLELKGSEKVLEIGTGSGYQAAILAQLAKEVYSVERIESLAKNAKKAFDGLAYNNIKTSVGDGTLGWQEYAPYDGIIVSAGAPGVPDALARQLEEGGRMVIPIGGAFSQVLTLVTREGDLIKGREICGCVFVPLIGEDGWKK